MSNAKEYMDFFDALSDVLLNGARITKAEWNDETIYGQLKDDHLALYRDGEWFQWIISIGDMSGKDWYALTSNVSPPFDPEQSVNAAL